MSERDPRWVIEPLSKRHDRAAFSCGVVELDEFLRRYARQNERIGLGRTFVATHESDPHVLGYFTLRTGVVELEDLPVEETRRFPRYPVPVVHLARLAVDRSMQGQRLGERLLALALRKAHDASKEIAVYAVEVLAIDDRAKRFYLKYGFKELVRDELHLYLPIKTIARLFE